MLEKALAQEPTYLEAVYLLAEVLGEEQRYTAAIDLWVLVFGGIEPGERWVGLGPWDSVLWNYLMEVCAHSFKQFFGHVWQKGYHVTHVYGIIAIKMISHDVRLW